MALQSDALKRAAKNVGKMLLCAVASANAVAGAKAADLDTFFKAPPVQPDLTWHGITLIGAIDVSGQYERYGAPYAGPVFTPASIIFPMSTGPRWLLASNQSIQSFVGFKIDERITDDFKFIARGEIGFNPTTGDLSDGIRSVQQANGIPLASQNVNGDSARAGQIFNGELWGGFDSKTFGSLHAGRNNNVSSDLLFAYDPLLSYGFSLLGFVAFVAGQGSTETPRIDQSVKYLNTVGWFRTELIYGAPNTNVKDFYQGSVGIVQPNFSVDIIGGHSDDSVSVGALSGAANLGSPLLGGRVFNTNSYGIFGKYVFDVGGKGFKDPTNSTFTVSGGYDRIDFSNPTDGGYGPGHITIGGYELGPAFSTNGAPGGGVVDYAYTGGDRLLDSYFIAGKYQHDEHWSVAVGYYIYKQNSYGFGVNSLAGIVAPSYSRTSCSSISFTNCSGTEQVASFRVDYDWTKNVKLYAGMAYSQVSGGLGFGYLNTYSFDPTVGFRYTF